MSKTLKDMLPVDVLRITFTHPYYDRANKLLGVDYTVINERITLCQTPTYQTIKHLEQRGYERVPEDSGSWKTTVWSAKNNDWKRMPQMVFTKKNVPVGDAVKQYILRQELHETQYAQASKNVKHDRAKLDEVTSLKEQLELINERLAKLG